MSADSKQIRDVLAGQLSDLDDSLGATVDDVQMLADIQQGIGRLLEDDGDAEGEIRQVLQERYEQGDLRKETYQLVKSMLDRFVTERLPTSPGNVTYDTIMPPADAPQDDTFSSTAVLPSDSFEPATADDQVQVGSVLRDRFLLQKRISGGSMGVVYRALDRRLAEAGAEQPWVAIKVLSPQLARSGPALRALQQEAAKGRCLSHPHIVRFIDLDRDDELYFIVMEWLEGRTLAEILDSPDGKSIDLAQSLRIVHQVGKALSYAHRCGIVHADVKPGNIMIAPDGSAKLFDFGVARVLQTQAGKNADPDAGVIGAMTPAYSSMQVLTGEEPVAADDVFSLGCLLYRLAAGHRVFGPRNAAEAADQGMKPQRIRSLSDDQWAALKKAISYARVTRFDSVSAFLDALGGRGEEVLRAEPQDAPFDHDTGGSRYWMYGLVAMLLVIGFAAYQFGLSDRVRDWLGERATAGQLPPPAGIPVPEGVAPAPEADAAEPEAPDIDTAPAESTVAAAAPAEPPGSAAIDEATAVDFSLLPPADLQVSLFETLDDRDPVPVTLREGGAPVSIDLMRGDRLDMPLSLRLEEISYSGNRSPWAAAQYRISNNGIVNIPPGQDRARVTLSIGDDPLREADQVSTLRVRQAETTRSSLASIDVVLEDDDQRRFEAGLPTNTIAFAVSQVAVSERDPAVQIDVLRFNPDDSLVVVGYSIRDITAVEGEDYFAPAGFSLSFGPRQRSARLLVPLVQDALVEGDEAFTVELATRDETLPNDVFQRTVVVIRDDEPPAAAGN